MWWLIALCIMCRTWCKRNHTSFDVGKIFSCIFVTVGGWVCYPLSIFGFLEFSSFVYVRHSLTVRVALHL